VIFFIEVSIAFKSEHANCSGAGTSVFGGRRWLDPDDPQEWQRLRDVSHNLCMPPINQLDLKSRHIIYLSRQGFHNLQQRFPRHLHCCEADFRRAIAALQVLHKIGHIKEEWCRPA
jgi:hypothetical protein